MKKVLFLLVVTTAVMLTACGHKHEWVEATCTEPRTCAACDETEGEPLGHTWVEATCTEPKTCTVCGETEGEALGHTLTEANYQSPAICTVCGETVGEPLVADFDELGYVCSMEIGVPYDFRTMCYSNASEKTVGTMTVTDYRIFESEGEYEANDGYEWRVATVEFSFFDENARRDGFLLGFTFTSYYDISFLENPDYDNYMVNYNGEDYEVSFVFDYTETGWVNGRYTITDTFAFSVPVGYDGIVIHGYDNEIREKNEDAEYFTDLYDPEGENANLLFRLD